MIMFAGVNVRSSKKGGMVNSKINIFVIIVTYQGIEFRDYAARGEKNRKLIGSS